MPKCLFMEKECVFTGIPEEAKWCRVCIESSVARFTIELSMMTKMTIINGLLLMHRDEKKAREIYKKLRGFAEEW